MSGWKLGITSRECTCESSCLRTSRMPILLIIMKLVHIELTPNDWELIGGYLTLILLSYLFFKHRSKRKNYETVFIKHPPTLRSNARHLDCQHNFINLYNSIHSGK
jgi:hypothetical protein